MPFDVKSRVPLYAGIALTIRIDVPETGVMVNGTVNDAFTDTAANAFFSGTVAEDLVGYFPYSIFRVAAIVQTGWLKRISGQAILVLDDPRDFPASLNEIAVATLGTGARTVTVAVLVSAVPLENATVRFTLGGETYSGRTNASGVVVFNLNDGTYTVAISKSGYSFAGTTMVVDGVETASYTMTSLPIAAAAGADECNVAVDVIDQFGDPYNGVSVSAVVGSSVTGADAAGILDRDAKSKLTVSGRATLTLIQGVTYTITFEKGHRSKSFSYLVPIAASALATQTF